MPWTPQDAAAHNARIKGSKKLQKQWAKVANSVLAAELKKGSKQSEAEGRAIARTGWPRAVSRPGLPQTRTCAINAFGSSSYPFATPRYAEWITRR